MNKTTKALKLAKEALEKVKKLFRSMTADECPDDPYISVGEALAAIREALAEPVKQEPVGVVEPSGEWGVAGVLIAGLPIGTKLYAAPVSAKREWVDLTDDEIDSVLRSYTKTDRYKDDLRSYRAVIAAFKEKNK